MKTDASKTQASADPLIGKVLDDRYKVCRKLSSGGMGVIYLGEHLHLGRTVIVKMLHRHLSQGTSEGEFHERFRREAKTASQIEHPGAVTIYDFGIHENRPYLVMQYNKGRSLKAILEEEGALDPARAVKLFNQIGAAVDAAHQLSIIHRDLKPENIMVSADSSGRELVQVLDFGIAKVMADTEAELNSVTKTGVVLGTPNYMAPEQALGGSIDCRTEVYSLGVILYEMLTGAVPFTAESPMKVMLKHIKEAPLAVRQAQPSTRCSAQLESVVMKALSKEPQNRFQHVKEMVQAAEDAVRVSDEPIGRMTKAAHYRPPGSRKKRAGAIAGMVFIGATMGFAMDPLVTYFSPEERARRAVAMEHEREAAEHVKSARELTRRGQTTAAVYELTQALKLSPNDPTIYLALGRAHNAAQRDDEAIVVLEKAVELNPDLEEAHLLIGNSYFRQSKFDQAIKAYKRVLTLNPKSKAAKSSLQLCLDQLQGGWKQR
ncbi:MAG: serine/threonine-protein kinase [Bdellovibrionota bacterium]